MMRSLTACGVLCGLLLAACSGFKSSEPAVQSYLLRPALPARLASAAPASDATLTVMLPVATAGLEGERIALIQGGQRLDWYRDARWSGELPLLVQTSIIDALRAGGRFAAVQSEDAPFGSTYLLEVEIRHFEADYSAGGLPRVRVELTGTLGKRIDRTVTASFTAAGQATADADRLQSVTGAFQTAFAQALDQLTNDLQPPIGST
jgi:cholesterol transport system auxiliary component